MHIYIYLLILIYLFNLIYIYVSYVYYSNHPQLAGGSHLPDITVITPVFISGRIAFFVASRGHHVRYVYICVYILMHTRI